MQANQEILVSGGYDNSLRFWDIQKGISSRYISYQESQVNCLRITRDKQYLGAAGHSSIKLYDLRSSSFPCVKSYEGHKNNITSFGFQKDLKYLYSASEDGTIKLWDMKATSCTRTFENGAPVTSIALHPNQKDIIASDESGAIKIWDLAEGSCRQQLIPNEDVPIRSLALTSNGSMLVAGGHDGTIYVWQITPSGDCIDYQQLPAHQGPILKVQCSPDKKKMASCGSDKRVKLWMFHLENQEFQKERVFHGHKRWVWDCVFSADSSNLVTVSTDMILRIWSMNGEFIELQGHSKGITAVTLSD